MCHVYILKKKSRTNGEKWLYIYIFKMFVKKSKFKLNKGKETFYRMGFCGQYGLYKLYHLCSAFRWFVNSQRYEIRVCLFVSKHGV